MNRSEMTAILLGVLLTLLLVACQARRAILPPAAPTPILPRTLEPTIRSTQAPPPIPGGESAMPITTPEPFTFVNQFSVSPDTLIVSAPIIVEGITVPVPISIERGEYSVDGGPFTREEGVVSSGQRVTVRHTSGSGPGSYASTVLTIGGVSDIFTSVTAGVAGGTAPDGPTTAAEPAPRPTFPSKFRGGRGPASAIPSEPGHGSGELSGEARGFHGDQPFLRGTQ